MNNSTHTKNSVALIFRRWQPKALLKIVVVLSLVFAGMSLTVGAQPKPRLPKQPASLSPNIKRLPPAQSSLNQKSILESLLGLLRRKPFLGGSRSNGDGFCAITPAVLGETNVIWSDHPLFLWKGKAQSVELRPYQFDVAYAKQPILWSFSPTAQQANYPNVLLEAGKRYEWQVTYVSPQTNEPSRWQQIFRVMDKAERDRMVQDLNSLQVRLTATSATTEEIALARANFFADQDLWSDALQQVYAVGSSFEAGNEFLQAMTARVCKAKSNPNGVIN